MTFKLTVESKRTQRILSDRTVYEPLLALELALDLVGHEVVTYLKSYTAELRPPASGQGSSRAAHPGHWADITGDLRNKYGYKVERTSSGVGLAIFNKSDHAVYVEAMDGYFVITGVNEEIMRRLRVVIPRIAPGWKLG
jgi:hypothetical protein